MQILFIHKGYREKDLQGLFLEKFTRIKAIWIQKNFKFNCAVIEQIIVTAYNVSSRRR